MSNENRLREWVTICLGYGPGRREYGPSQREAAELLLAAADEIAALKKDKERLDWLEKSPRLSAIHVDGRIDYCHFYGVAGAPMFKLREIIDAAIKAEEQAK